MRMSIGAQANPLAEHELFHTTDLVEAQESAVPVTAPHRLRLHGRAAEFDASIHAARVGPTWLGIMRYGAELTMDRPAYQSYVSVVVPLTGRLTLVRGGQDYVATPNLAMGVLSPGDGDLHVRWSRGTTVMTLTVEADELTRSLRWIAPHTDESPFTASSPLLTGPAQFSILGTMQLYCEVFSRYGPHRAIPQPLAKQLREQTLSTMWLSVPNNHTDTIFRAPASGEGFRVGQARDLIASESRAEYTVPSLARAVSIGVRALEIAFRKEFDETPLQYLRRTRLERTHDELGYLDPAQATVSEIAVRWGFGHLGRFAAQYRARFGEMPSETLARPTR